MASISIESRTVSSGASSQRRPATGRGASKGVMRAEDLLIDIGQLFWGWGPLRLGCSEAQFEAKVPATSGWDQCSYWSCRQRHQRHSPSVWAEGSSFYLGVEGRGMLYFFLCHSDFYYMHVLMNSFWLWMQGNDKIPGQGACSTFLWLLFSSGTHQQYAERVGIWRFPADPLVHHEARD